MGPRRNAALIKLQQSIDDLGPPLILDGKSYKSTYDFRNFGFMVVKDFVDKSLISAAKTESMKKRFLDNSKVRNISNNKGSRRRSEGIGQRLQIITKTKDAEDHDALRYFSRAQKNLFNACREKVVRHAQMLLDTDEGIDLVETVLLSLDNSTVRQTPHPDLKPEYDSKAVLAFVSLEDHTTLVIYSRSHDWEENPDYRRIGRRYGILAGDALFFHPSCIHAGDSYVKSNIRLHYYAFKTGTEWKEDSAYSVPTPTARMLTHDPKVVANTLKRSLSARESYEQAVETRRQMSERGIENLRRGWDQRYVARRIIIEEYHAIAEESIEAVKEESQLP